MLHIVVLHSYNKNYFRLKIMLFNFQRSDGRHFNFPTTYCWLYLNQIGLFFKFMLQLLQIFLNPICLFFKFMLQLLQISLMIVLIIHDIYIYQVRIVNSCVSCFLRGWQNYSLFINFGETKKNHHSNSSFFLELSIEWSNLKLNISLDSKTKFLTLEPRQVLCGHVGLFWIVSCVLFHIFMEWINFIIMIKLITLYQTRTPPEKCYGHLIRWSILSSNLYQR